MRVLPFAGALVALSLCSPAAAQDAAVVSAGEMDAALEARGTTAEEDRAVVARVLARGDVEAAARSAGMGDALADARGAVAGLEGRTLERAAGHARALERQLAGGQAVTITTVGLIVILLVLILVILVAT